jgi:hypothetical protein
MLMHSLNLIQSCCRNWLKDNPLEFVGWVVQIVEYQLNCKPSSFNTCRPYPSRNIEAVSNLILAFQLFAKDRKSINSLFTDSTLPCQTHRSTGVAPGSIFVHVSLICKLAEVEMIICRKYSAFRKNTELA